ncbi:MAG: hypothetical protein AAF211_30265, partial [Myxococcota bacterium]
VEGTLRQGGDLLGLALLMGRRAEFEARRGESAAARADLEAVRALVEDLDFEVQSELLGIKARCERILGS